MAKINDQNKTQIPQATGTTAQEPMKQDYPKLNAQKIERYTKLSENQAKKSTFRSIKTREIEIK